MNKTIGRIGDLIKGDPAKKKHRDSRWLAPFETTMSRIRRAPSVTAPAGYSFILRLKPTKTDTSGEEEWEAHYPVDLDPDALSAGGAMQLCLDHGDFLPAAAEDPLFADTATGSEMTYAYVKTRLERGLVQCGFSEFEDKPHGKRTPQKRIPTARCIGLRIGGGSCAADDPHGGELTSAMMGTWTTRAAHSKYLWSMQARIERTAVSMARRHDAALIIRPGPVTARR
jgi:hypothetical protein